MRTFSEWVQENHPEDESLNEELGRIGRALATAAIGVGSMLGGSHASQAAMPMPPQMSQEEGYSVKPFNRDLAISLAREMGTKHEALENMNDFDLWHWQLKRVRETQKIMIKQRKQLTQEEGPLWYIKLGHYYGWKTPKPPEVVAGGARGAVPGGVMTGGGMAGPGGVK